MTQGFMNTHAYLTSASQQAWWGIPLIRLMVGTVFLSEGLQKFIYPAARGPGRFEDIGFSHPEFWGSFVGAARSSSARFFSWGF